MIGNLIAGVITAGIGAIVLLFVLRALILLMIVI